MQKKVAQTLHQKAFADIPVVLTGSVFSPFDIASDRSFSNAAELFVKNEPCVMAAMRTAGVEEAYITGDTSDFDKFKALAQAAPLLIGNTAFLSCQAALSALFDCNIPLDGAHCEEIWALVADKLSQGGGIASLLARAGVTEAALPVDPLVTTDWPSSGVIAMRPVFAPFAAFCESGRNFVDAVRQFGQKYGTMVRDFKDFGCALCASLDAYAAWGCRSALQPLVPYVQADAYHADQAFQKALSGKALSRDERSVLSCWLTGFLGREYLRRGMTLRFVAFPEKDAKRYSFFEGTSAPAKEIRPLFDYLLSCRGLPRTVLCTAYGDLTEYTCLCAAYPALDGTPHVSLALDDRSPFALCTSLDSLAQSGALGTCLLESGLDKGLLAPFFAKQARLALNNFVAQRCEKILDPAQEEVLLESLSAICQKNAAII